MYESGLDVGLSFGHSGHETPGPDGNPLAGVAVGVVNPPVGRRSRVGGSNLSYPHVGALTGPLLTSVVASLTVALGLSSVIGLAGGVVLCLFVDETLSVTVDSHQGSERESRDAR